MPTIQVWWMDWMDLSWHCLQHFLTTKNREIIGSWQAISCIVCNWILSKTLIHLAIPTSHSPPKLSIWKQVWNLQWFHPPPKQQKQQQQQKNTIEQIDPWQFWSLSDSRFKACCCSSSNFAATDIPEVIKTIQSHIERYITHTHWILLIKSYLQYFIILYIYIYITSHQKNTYQIKLDEIKSYHIMNNIFTLHILYIIYYTHHYHIYQSIWVIPHHPCSSATCRERCSLNSASPWKRKPGRKETGVQFHRSVEMFLDGILGKMFFSFNRFGVFFDGIFDSTLGDFFVGETLA